MDQTRLQQFRDCLNRLRDELDARDKAGYGYVFGRNGYEKTVRLAFRLACMPASIPDISLGKVMSRELIEIMSAAGKKARKTIKDDPGSIRIILSVVAEINQMANRGWFFDPGHELTSLSNDVKSFLETDLKLFEGLVANRIK